MSAIVLGNLCVDLDASEVAVSERPVRLTRLEFDLARALARVPNRIISAEAIEELLWQRSGRMYSDRLAVLVHRVRGKLSGSYPYHLQSVRRRGYGFLAEISAFSGQALETER